MTRWVAGLGIVASLLAVTPASAVVDGRGTLALAGQWFPAGPFPDTSFYVSVAASNEIASISPPCVTTWTCSAQGVVTITSNQSYSYRGQVTCMWVEGFFVYLGVLGGSGDVVRPGAALVYSDDRDPRSVDSFGLIEDQPFDCQDLQVRRSLLDVTGPIRGAGALVTRCPPPLVCPDRSL